MGVFLLKDQEKSKVQLIAELKRLRQRILNLEMSEKKHKQIENALRESEEKYRALVNGASDAIVIVDENGNIFEANRKMEELLGYLKGDLIGKNIIDVHPVDELKRTVAAFKDIIKSGEGVLYNAFALAKDGRVIPVDITGSVVRYSGRAVMQGIFRDVSERKASEERLLASKKRYHLLLDALQEGVWAIDEHSNTVFANTHMAEMLGYTVNDMIGKHAFSFISKEYIDFFEHKNEQRKKGIKERFDLGLVKKDGRTIYVLIESAPIFDDEGNFRGSIAGITDITENRRIMKEYVKSEEKFRNIFDKSPMGIFQSTIDGKFISVNPALARMLGYGSAQEVISSISDISRQIYANPKQCEEFVKIMRMKPDAARFEGQFIRKDGSVWSGKLTIRIISDENNIPHHLDGFVEDITKQKETEEKLKQAMKRLSMLSRRLLEVQETERRHIARELHDEIGQALTAVKINLQAVERAGNKKSTMIPIQECIRVVDRLLQQVRNLSIELHPSILDDLGLVAALRWYVDWLSQQSIMKGSFVTNLTEERLSSVLELTCFRVAQEALTNVVRHARAKNIIVELEKKEGHIHLRIIDDGVGFDVANARADAIKGYSLGLLGMEERISLVKGFLELKSVIGKGTEVNVILPYEKNKNITR
ncbi:MAG: Oxygen sensor histidine kinase NreB [Deltaproteobacteria bacterium ADurb.Bin026]|nr:MAG: Oxygen sensor histidine kinase NreB [Deltaproteobacteria bacterium ADurb.Bin026]